MKYLLSLMIIFTSSIAHAGCWLDNSEYPVGTVIDGYECGADGNWAQIERN